MTPVDYETLDAIRELLNIGVGKAAAQLNDMTGHHIRLQVPTVRLQRFTEIATDEQSVLSRKALSTVKLSFRGAFSGVAAIVFPQESAVSLVMLLTGETEKTPDLDAMRTEALKEVGNITLNAVMGSIANVLKTRLTYTIPDYYEGPISAIHDPDDTTVMDEWVLLARTTFQIESLNIEGDILLILEVGSLGILGENIEKTVQALE